MKLTKNGLESEEWSQKNYELPQFQMDQVIKNTHENPFWIHFGGGNIFRAFQANAVQKGLNQGILDSGLIVADSKETVENLYRPHDNLCILATLKGDGTIKKTVVSSITESLVFNTEAEADWARLLEIFRNPALQMVSFTITEKGYVLKDSEGKFRDEVEKDFSMGPVLPESYFGKVATLLHERFISGENPVSFVSMDNCSHNGDKLYAAINEFAEEWENRGVCKSGFVEYVNNKSKVAFPWTMIDKITPRPDKAVKEMLLSDGVENLEDIITARKTFASPFVNAEETEYLVIEDDFPNGRPELEKCGFYFTDRATVDKVERMKVCTCLNPLHTFLALSGCLLGCKKISEEMQDRDLSALVRKLGREEGLPVVENPGIINPEKFLEEVINIRLPNKFLPDTPQRIACDTSQKLSIRFGQTIKGYLANPQLDINKLRVIPLTFALYLRYLKQTDDEGNAFELSPDPLKEELISLKAEDLLRRTDIFGVDLYEAGLAEKVQNYLEKLSEGEGSVRKVIHDEAIFR